LYLALASALGLDVQKKATPNQEIERTLAKRLPLRILLAEDNMINQKVVVRLLERLGYRADAVANGLEVLEALGRAPYDVVLMDVHMPEMDGLEASRKIVETWPRARRPRIIAITAAATHQDRDQCFEAGMDDYISKPIELQELTEALKRCLKLPTGDGRLGDAPEVTDDAAVLDREALQKLQESIGGQDYWFMRELLESYLDNAATLVEKMGQAFRDRDPRSLNDFAHTLRSSSKMIGANELAVLCKAVELNNGRVSAQSIEQLETLSGKVNVEVQIEIDRLTAAGSNGVG